MRTRKTGAGPYRIIGASFLLLGLYAIFVTRWLPRGRRASPVPHQRGVLVAYYVITPYLGYTLSTLVISTVLYRAMGG